MPTSTPQDDTSAPRVLFDASCWGGLNFRSVRSECPGCGGEDLRTVVFAPNSGLVGPTLYCRNGCVVIDGYPLEETKAQKRQRRKDFPALWQQAQPFGALPIREASGFLIGVRLPDGTEVFWPEAVEATPQDTDDSATDAESAPTDSPVGAAMPTLVQARQLADEASPGPWTSDTGVRGDCVVWGPNGKFLANVQAEPHWVPEPDGSRRQPAFDVDRRDADFIAASRILVPALLDTVDDVLTILDQAAANTTNRDVTALIDQLRGAVTARLNITRQDA